MRTTLSLLAAAATVQASLYGESNLNHSCIVRTNPQASGVLSCSANANPSIVDSCCAETFGGLLLSTQFWDTYTGLEAQGQLLPEDTWTLHGLWPDFCNGSYTQYCDFNRQYDPSPSPKTQNGLANGSVVPPWTGPTIDTFGITPFGAYDLLAYMNTFWINQGGSNADFWAHEFSKHATCFSTFDTPCYGPAHRNGSEILEFFETAIMYYRRFPTFGWLNAAGIKPSNSTRYSTSQLSNTLAAASGAVPYLGCSGPRFNTTAAGANSTDRGYTQLSEVWYYMHAYGRPQAGVTLPVNASAPTSSCCTTPGCLQYLERTPASVRRGVAALY